MAPLLPWPAMLWLLPFAPRAMATARLAWRSLKPRAAELTARVQALRTVKPWNLEILKHRSLPWNG